MLLRDSLVELPCLDELIEGYRGFRVEDVSRFKPSIEYLIHWGELTKGVVLKKSAAKATKVNGISESIKSKLTRNNKPWSTSYRSPIRSCVSNGNTYGEWVKQFHFYKGSGS